MRRNLMIDMYAQLLSGLNDLSAEDEGPSSIDSFLSENRVKVSSLDELLSFVRIGEETLVHKSKKDLWRISESDGDMVIERLFDPSTNKALKV